MDYILTWLNGIVVHVPSGDFCSSSTSQHPTAGVLVRATRELGCALQGENDRQEHWILLAETVMFLEAICDGKEGSHPADVVALNCGVLTSLGQREKSEPCKRYHPRASGTGGSPSVMAGRRSQRVTCRTAASAGGCREPSTTWRGTRV